MPPEESDDSLIAAAANGDEAAFNRLVRRHADRAHALARRYLGSSAEADDVLQDAFWRAWNAMGRWRAGEAQFSTWLHRVVVNLCIDRTRRARIRNWLSFDKAPELADDRLAADDVLEASDELRAVLGDLARLPDRQRAAILLSAEGDRPNAEIAGILGVSEKAVESLLVRARRTLRLRVAERVGET